MLKKLRRNQNAFTLLLEMQIGSTIVEDSVAIPQRRENRNIHVSNPITGNIPKGI